MAVEKWRHYLEQEQFIIQTDHESLKYLLDQKIHTAIQKKGLTKLLGLRYKILYRKGRENIVYKEGILGYKGRIVVGKEGHLKTQLVKSIHDPYVGGHAGIQNTYRRLKTNFYWYGMKAMVKQAVEECNVCR